MPDKNEKPDRGTVLRRFQARLNAALQWLKRVMTEPRGELTRWQKAARSVYDFVRYGARQLQEDQAPQMAAALSFRALFGLLPVLVVGTLIVKALGGFEKFVAVLADFFVSMGLDAFQRPAHDGAAAATAPGTAQSLSEWLLDLVRQTETINLAAITWVGVAVLIYSAVSLMVTIEGCFNGICRAPEGRSWGRRIPIYWTVLTLAPAAIMLTVYVDSRFEEFLANAVSWMWLLRLAPILSSFLATWIVMAVLYRLLPNTRMGGRNVLVGALVSAVLLEIGKRSMGAYLQNALSISHLYGSLGLIPLFMFWVYLMWLVVLFGLEVTATLQRLAGRTLHDIESTRRRTGLVDPASILLVMGVAAERFHASSATTARQVAEETGMDESTIESMLHRLAEAGVLHRIDRPDMSYSLARPADTIPASVLIDIGFSMVDAGASARRLPLMARLREAQRTLAAEATLAQLLGPAAVASEADHQENTAP